MTDLYFYNTASRRKEQFAPINAACVRIYVCGPTVYDYAHIGNARPVIVFDILYRLLRHVYGAQAVHYVRNITDVDDKINARAARDYPDLPLNQAIARLTQKTEAQFHADVAALVCLPPNAEPKATDHIDAMKRLIERLLAKKYAYVAANNVLFSVSAMNESGRQHKTPFYGRLSRRPQAEMLAGARVEVADYKRDEQDFVLWKPSAAGEPGWPSPAGIAVLGRPGWHIECSAMSMVELLEPYGGGLECDNPQQNCFDIHGGGLDLIFPHHENEIAQSCCALGAPHMANFWLHNGFVQVEGNKMSKTLGNFITIRQILETELPEFNGHMAVTDKQRWAGLSARFAMLQSHYRQPLDWTQTRFEAASAELYKWYAALQKSAGKYGLAVAGDDNLPQAASMGKNASARFKPELRTEALPPEFLKILADDMNMPQAIALLRHYYKQAAFKNLIAGLAFIGLLDIEFLRPLHALFEKRADISNREIEAVIKQRLESLEKGDYTTADRLRADLAQHGVRLIDSKDKDGRRLTKWEIG
ncbi:cysteine--tRNA ligase [Candidatus Tokpelaia sp.]|uniref:cysteine--tRNA ligase n=1 Tax=Candidatus Tokpelaia sp. TaxID=2233777 RepID=UPI00123B0658|nr:cysteine--tRNA ligase [Candidatus Tokpelaia sp.]KAA6405522.1 cysteine--tRNA ligase [Candidatus Tokpelaia sp.]